MKSHFVVTLKNLPDAVKQLVFGIEADITPKIKSLIIKTIMEAGEEEQKKWLKNIEQALSDPLPANMLHKKRQPRNRLFPYLVTGELKNSLKTDLYIVGNSKNYTTLKWWFGIMSPHATYTTNAYRSKDNPGWKGWAKRTLQGPSYNIPSANGRIQHFFRAKVERILKGKL